MDRKLIALVLISALMCCCASHTSHTLKLPNASEKSGLKIILPFSKFPKNYTCDGADISPPIILENVSKKAKSIAVVMIDLDAPKGIFVHWVAWNIPANVSEIPENIPKKPVVYEPIRIVQGRNDFGSIGYGGPCPPSGVHRYVINVYTLNCYLNLSPGSSANALYRAMNGHVLQHAEVVITYSR